MPVEPVHDPRTVLLPTRRPAGKAVHERPGSVPGPRVDDDARGLVDDEKVLVLERHPERHVLGLELGDFDLGRLELDLLSALEAVALRAHGAVHADSTMGEQSLRRRA
jgi:hypothetical protein